MKIESLYLSNFCRLCFNKNDYVIDIFQVVQSEEIIEKLEYCTGIKIPRHDSLLREICLPCLNLLDTAYFFKTTCLKSDRIYKQILNANVIIKDTTGKHEVASNQLKTEDKLISFSYEDCTSKAVKKEVLDIPLKEEDFNYEQMMSQYDSHDDSINNDSISVDRGQSIPNSKNVVSPKLTSCDSNERSIDPEKATKIKRRSTKKSKFVLPSSFTVTSTSPRSNLKSGEDTTKKETERVIYKCVECHFETKCKSWVIKHANRHKNRRYKCVVCGLSHTSQERYDTHLRSHGMRSSFPCPICACSFLCPQNLLQHRRIVHNDFTYVRPSYAEIAKNKEPKFRCRPCAIDFGTKYECSKHYRSVHLKSVTTENAADWQICDICGIRYKGTDHRLRHFPPQYECDTCSQKFVTKNELATHFDFRHVGKTRYMCGVCGKFARCKTSLATHYERQHRPASYRCAADGCARAFHTRHVFKQHLIAHRSPRSRHECKLCGVHRTRRNLLDLHMMKDHGVCTKGEKNSTFIAFYKYYLTEKDVKEIEAVYHAQVSAIEALYRIECVGGSKVYVLGGKKENKHTVKSVIDGKRIIRQLNSDVSKAVKTSISHSDVPV